MHLDWGVLTGVTFVGLGDISQVIVLEAFSGGDISVHLDWEVLTGVTVAGFGDISQVTVLDAFNGGGNSRTRRLGGELCLGGAFFSGRGLSSRTSRNWHPKTIVRSGSVAGASANSAIFGGAGSCFDFGAAFSTPAVPRKLDNPG